MVLCICLEDIVKRSYTFYWDPANTKCCVGHWFGELILFNGQSTLLKFLLTFFSVASPPIPVGPTFLLVLIKPCNSLSTIEYILGTRFEPLVLFSNQASFPNRFDICGKPFSPSIYLFIPLNMYQVSFFSFW